jgi:hypothetical protein
MAPNNIAKNTRAARFNNFGETTFAKSAPWIVETDRSTAIEASCEESFESEKLLVERFSEPSTKPCVPQWSSTLLLSSQNRPRFVNRKYTNTRQAIDISGVNLDSHNLTAPFKSNIRSAHITAIAQTMATITLQTNASPMEMT